MKKFTLLVALCLGAFSFLHAQLDSLSYSIGVVFGENLKAKNIKDIKTADVAQAMNDVLKEQNLKISAESAASIFQEYIKQQELAMHEVNKTKGETFLAENGKRAEVITTESGLQYEILTKGTGAIPVKSDQVVAHYHGTLIDGTLFDSSVERGQPATFPVGNLIPGWVEALQIMPTGSKWRLFIPYNLAYGERGAGGVIPPYAALIFDLELIEIK